MKRNQENEKGREFWDSVDKDAEQISEVPEYKKLASPVLRPIEKKPRTFKIIRKLTLTTEKTIRIEADDFESAKQRVKAGDGREIKEDTLPAKIEVVTPRERKKRTIVIQYCPRCVQEHPLELKELSRSATLPPIKWGMCPVKNEPVIVLPGKYFW